MHKMTALAFIFVLLSTWPVQGARTYIVDDDQFADYRSIVEAVASASDGDTVFVKPGIYREEVVLDKKLSIKPLAGETGQCILEGTGLSIGIKVVSNGCHIEGLTISNFNGPAIYLSSDRNTVVNNVFERDRLGIFLRQSSSNTIEGNIARGCDTGIGVNMNSDKNTISKNTAEGCNASIVLNDVKSNTLTANKAVGCMWGVNLLSAHENILTDTRIGSASVGIMMSGSINNTISGSTIFNSTMAFNMVGSPNSAILNNRIEKAEEGIWIKDCGQSMLSGNNLSDVLLGLYVDATAKEGFNNNIDETNIIDGRPILYMYGRKDLLVQGRELSHVTIAVCENCTLHGNTVTNDALFIVGSNGCNITENNVSQCWGIRVLTCNNSVISSNTAAKNRYSGIYMIEASESVVSLNNLTDNMQNGLSLSTCSNNTIQGNTGRSNGMIGMWLNSSDGNDILENNLEANLVGLSLYKSSSNRIYHNNFLDNGEQAEDRLGANLWDLGNVTGGNYWSDHHCVGSPCQGIPKLTGGAALDRYPFGSEDGWKIPKAT